VSHSSEGQLYSGSGVTIERTNLSRDAGYLTIKTAAGTRNYLGNFSVSAYNGVLTVINKVPFSHYLYGVVGYEMSNTFPLEALKAQALAAKGYALLKIRSTGSYDIGDTADDQVYKGYDPSYQNVINAVDSTMGDALYYNNMPLYCYYAASNGGWMILPSVRWSSPIYDGAYNSGADPYDMANPATPMEKIFLPGDYSEKEMGTAAFAFLDARLMAAVAGRGIVPKNHYFAGIQSIDSVESSGTAGYKGDLNHTTITVTATVRSNLNEALMPTPTPTFDPTPSPTPSFDPTPSPTPEIETVRNTQVSVSFTFDEMIAYGLYNSKTLKIYYAAPTTDGWYLYHARYGHGVGMSQRGAQQMANLGKTYREILGFYYPGATLGTMAYVFPETIGTAQPTTADTYASTGTVQGGTVNLRAKASTSSTVVESLSKDTQVTLLGMTGEWYYVSAPSGNTGYIRHDYILLTGSSLIAQGKVSGSAVNYRTGPATSYSVISQLSLDTQLGIYGMVNGWYKVKAMTTGIDGFVSEDYVTLTQEVAQNTATAAPPTAPATPVPTAVAAPTATVEGATPTPVPFGTPTPLPTATPAPTPSTTLAPDYAAAGAINADGVNIRAGSSTASKSYGKLMKNTELGLYEKVGSWYRVRVSATGLDGFVYAKYVSITQTGAGSSASGGSAYSKGYINASGVNVRTGASTRYNNLGTFARNTSVRVLGSSGSWYQIEIPSADVTGYVFAKYVTLTETVKTTQSTGVVTGRLNLRAQPSTSAGSRVLLTMDRGSTVTVYSTTNGWCYVDYNGTKGYCYAAYVKMS